MASRQQDIRFPITFHRILRPVLPLGGLVISLLTGMAHDGADVETSTLRPEKESPWLGGIILLITFYFTLLCILFISQFLACSYGSLDARTHDLQDSSSFV